MFTGLVNATASIEVQGGVYAVGKLTAGGTVTKEERQCSGETCISGTISVTGSLGIEGRLGGEACVGVSGLLVTDWQECRGLTIVLGGNGAATGFATGSTCTGFDSGICFEGLQGFFKVSATITRNGVEYGGETTIQTRPLFRTCP